MGIEDISIQGAFPDAHRVHWIPGNHGSDFIRRLELYRGFSEKIDSADISASEVIGFVKPDGAAEVIAELENILGNSFSVIRATSPIDHNTVWIEVFPKGVNKASACEFIRRELGIEREMTAALGNDWNDVHMLEWAAVSFMVENSPLELRSRFRAVPSNNAGGVAAAAREWLELIR